MLLATTGRAAMERIPTSAIASKDGQEETARKSKIPAMTAPVSMEEIARRLVDKDDLMQIGEVLHCGLEQTRLET